MTATNRASLLTKIHKVLKKHYKPGLPPAERTILEHLLYSCCLENARPEAADEAFARMQQSYFDWNEVRVTTVAELAEQLSNLPQPNRTAQQLKRALQAVFEAHFAFDLEPLRKQNLGKSEKDLERYAQNNPFLIAYVVQHGLGGHAIPCCQGTIDALLALAVITPAEAARLQVPGIERAIPKNKGLEFASLLHQLGADFAAAPPFSQRLRGILTEIDPESKDRLPKKQRREEDLAPLPPHPRADKEALVRASLEKASKEARAKEAAKESAKEAAREAQGRDPAREAAGKPHGTKEPGAKEHGAKDPGAKEHARDAAAREGRTRDKEGNSKEASSKDAGSREPHGKSASKDARPAKDAAEAKKRSVEPPRKPARVEGKADDRKHPAKKLIKKKPR